MSGVLKNWWILVLYLVPSSLYAVYNNVSFHSLAVFNPTSYFMFMQIRLLLTGLVYQVTKQNIFTNIYIYIYEIEKKMSPLASKKMTIVQNVKVN